MLPFSPARFGNPAALAGGASYTPPLDAINSKVWVAYGLNRLYAGVAESLRVRRSSDSTESDINTLAAGDFDAASFATFIGGGNGFAATAYDQKTSNTLSDMVQVTAGTQPEVITASNIGSRAALRFTGVKRLAPNAGTFPLTNLATIGTGDFEMWAVVYPTSSASTRAIGSIGGQVWFYTTITGNGRAGVYLASGYKDFNINVSINTAHVIRFYRVSGVIYCDVDGTTAGSSFASTDNLTLIGSYQMGDGSEPLLGDIANFIIINGALTTAEKNALKTSLASYYGITVS